MIALSIIFVMLGAVALGVIAKRITRPLDQIKKNMQAVARLEFENLDGMLEGPCTKHLAGTSRISWDRWRPTGCSLKEVTEIQDAFAYMATGLRSFSRYMDPYVVQLLVKSKLPAKLGVAKADVTVFFSDIVGFSTIAETLPQEQFMCMLGTYLDEMSDIIMAHDGLVGEFVGDAIMAWWNAPLQLGEGHTAAALASALEQQRRLAQLGLEWAARGLPRLRARMGLVRGEVLAGNIGSKKRMKYGLVGDCVNLASRLESLCKHYCVNILIDGEACDAPFVKECFFVRPVDLVTVKGRQSETQLFELVAAKGAQHNHVEEPAKIPCDSDEEDIRAYCDDFAAVHARYRAADFVAALRALEAYRRRWPDDVPAQLLQQRCQALVLVPPEGEWSPVEILTHK